jgi:hypothetical protein
MTWPATLGQRLGGSQCHKGYLRLIPNPRSSYSRCMSNSAALGDLLTPIVAVFYDLGEVIALKMGFLQPLVLDRK